MKKITLLFLMMFCFGAYAQQSVFFTDFTDDTYPGWAFYDQDGDGNNWGDLNQIGDGSGGFTTPPSLISRSWQSTPLTPDNWAVSPAIDLTNASGTIDLEYITQVAAASWDEEKYSLYISTSDDINVLTTLTADFTETLGDALDTGIPVTHNFDLSGFAGQVIYVVFRHWDCTDEDFLAIHSMEVTATTLSTDTFNTLNFNYFVDAQNMLNLNANEALSQVKLYNMLGQEVMSKNLSNQNEAIDINALNTGVYLAKVQINNAVETFKFVKK